MEQTILNFINKLEGELFLLKVSEYDELLELMKTEINEFLILIKKTENVIFERSGFKLIYRLNIMLRNYIAFDNTFDILAIPRLTIFIDTIYNMFNKLLNNIKKDFIYLKLKNIIYLERKDDFNYIRYLDLFFYYKN